MTIVVRSQGAILGDLQGEIDRLETLLVDLRYIANGHLPSAKSIEMAPLIDNWVTSSRPEPCLIGEMHGHPICEGPISITSGLQIFAPEFNWARTSSRFYRLGFWHSDRHARLQ